jgi:kynureninase
MINNSEKIRADFDLNNSVYLLNHSVGRPLKSVESNLSKIFFDAWKTNEPWHEWMNVFSEFQQSLGNMLTASPENFCPQVNLSAALTKIFNALPKRNGKQTILLSEYDFPSIGFVAEQAKNLGYHLKFISKDANQTQPEVWKEAMTEDVQWIIITQVQSNTGIQTPVKEIVSIANEKNILSVVDVAQAVGILPVNINEWNPSFVIGSCVKWLCGGPGAGFLYVNSNLISACEPTDVGWFSHENPFEFDIHHFKYHPTALRFFGGTPSVIPFVIATQSIQYLNAVGIKNIRNHNVELTNKFIQSIPAEYVVSPLDTEHRSGTIILNFKNQQQKIIEKLKENNVAFDARVFGIRLSPHIYNSVEEIEKVIGIFTH